LPVDLFELRRTYALSAAQAKLVSALITHRRLLSRDIERELKIVTDAKVAIHNLRQKLMPHGIVIHSMRDGGYWFDDATKQVIIAAVTPAT